MTEKANSSIFLILASLICLLTISSCLTRSALQVTSVSANMNAVQALLSDHSVNPEHSGMQHGTVKGKLTNIERLADISDKYCPFESKTARHCYNKDYFKTTILTSLQTYSSELLNSSHLVPATRIRI